MFRFDYPSPYYYPNRDDVAKAMEHLGLRSKRIEELTERVKHLEQIIESIQSLAYSATIK